MKNLDAIIDPDDIPTKKYTDDRIEVSNGITPTNGAELWMDLSAPDPTGPQGGTPLDQPTADARYLQLAAGGTVAGNLTVTGTFTQRDTGWRNLTTLLANGWTPRAGTNGLLIRRIGNIVFLKIEALDPPATWNAVIITTLSTGFFPTIAPPHFPLVGQSSWTVLTANSAMVGAAVGNFLQITGSGSITKGVYIDGYVSYPTDEVWPSTLPGVAA